MILYLLSLFFVLLNFSLYKIVKKFGGIRYHLLVTFLYFIAIILFSKVYYLLSSKEFPPIYGFIVMLFFSLGILILTLFKKIINNRVNVSEELGVEEYFWPFFYLKLITIIVTFFQMIMILSGKIYLLQN